MIRSRKGISGKILAVILSLILAVALLWFFSGFFIKFLSSVGEAAVSITCDLLNWFIDIIGMGIIPHVCE